MAEYIEREKVCETLHNIGGCGAEPESWADGWDKAIDTAIEEISEIPAADVRKEWHGRCVTEHDGLPFCSECNCNDYGGLLKSMTYCPRCGAKMDGEDGEQE